MSNCTALSLVCHLFRIFRVRVLFYILVIFVEGNIFALHSNFMSMDILKKHLLINAALLVAYQMALFLWIGTMEHSSERELGFLIFSACAIAIHLSIALVYIVYHAISGNREKVKAQAISIALILTVGFSSCAGLANVV